MTGKRAIVVATILPLLLAACGGGHAVKREHTRHATSRRFS